MRLRASGSRAAAYDLDALLKTCAGLLDRRAQEGLITLVATMEETKVDTALATILSAMEQIRERKAIVAAELHKLDDALVGLERLAGQLSGEPLTSAPSAADMVAPHSHLLNVPGRASEAEIQVEAAQPDEPETRLEAEDPDKKPKAEVEITQLSEAEPRSRAMFEPRALPVYYCCDKCYGFHGWDDSCSSALSWEDLDRRHGEHGWVCRERRMITMEDIERTAMLRRIEEGRAAQAAAIAKQEAVSGKTPTGLRPDSKNHKIYMATKEILEKNGKTYLDTILSDVQNKHPDIFGGVKDPRMNLSNILSLLKSRRLLASDHRGYWWLPDGRAAE